jgi:hypothetical protein
MAGARRANIEEHHIAAIGRNVRAATARPNAIEARGNLLDQAAGQARKPCTRLIGALHNE